MRALVVCLLLVGCEKSESSGAEEARLEAEALQKQKEQSGLAAPVIRPPVRGETKIPCEQLIDPGLFTQALGE